MLLSGMTVKIIMKDFNGAALWAICAALLSGVGLMHSFMFTAGDTVLDFANPAWPWTVGYLLMALVFVTVKYTAQSTE
jgi:hypothetical protein